MLERVRIEGFKLLRSVDVQLRPLTVLIGQNDTGKSSFLRAIMCCLDGWIGHPSYAWRGEGPIAVTLDTAPPEAFSATRRFAEPDSDGTFQGDIDRVRGAIRGHLLVELPRSGPPMAGAVTADALGPPLLSTSGGGLPSLLDHLQRRDRPRFDKLVEAARRRISGLADITLVAASPGDRSVFLRVEGGYELQGDLTSAGVRVLMFFLAAAYHPRPGGLLLVEEPETGLHPSRLKDVVDLFRSLTRGEHGDPPTQVILTTHSPYLLDHIDPAEDQVLVFRRGADGAATVEPADQDRLSEFLSEFMLGEVWFNQGEEGLVARQPNE